MVSIYVPKSIFSDEKKRKVTRPGNLDEFVFASARPVLWGVWGWSHPSNRKTKKAECRPKLRCDSTSAKCLAKHELIMEVLLLIPTSVGHPGQVHFWGFLENIFLLQKWTP